MNIRWAVISVFLFSFLASISGAEAADFNQNPTPSLIVGMPRVKAGIPYLHQDDMTREASNARRDHISLTVMLLNMCFMHRDLSVNPLPTSGARLRGRILNDVLYPQSKIEPGTASESETETANMVPNEFTFRNAMQRASTVYSDRLRRDRETYQDILDDKKLISVRFQWTIAVVGALATVMIGIKAFGAGTEHPKTSVIVGIVALVASASGTALSSMNAFYGSQEEVIRNQRTIAQLTQLHWRVVQDALSDPDICKDSTDFQGESTSESESMKKVSAWKQRHEEILNDAMPSFSRPGDVMRHQSVQPPETKKSESPKPETEKTSLPVRPR